MGEVASKGHKKLGESKWRKRFSVLNLMLYRKES